MTKNFSASTALFAGLAAGPLLVFTLAGCMTDGAAQGRGDRGYQTGAVQTTVMIQDDYDYYPGYEVYYSRNRHEYVYRDGNAWVRRPAPRGVSVSVLLASPSVRADFHDSPEQHQGRMSRDYPKNWRPAAPARNDRGTVRDDRKDARPDAKNIDRNTVRDDRKGAKPDARKTDRKNVKPGDKQDDARKDPDQKDKDDHDRN